MLKRHLKTAYDMSPEDYRERWGLAADYPMVAPNYAKQRSQTGQTDRAGNARAESNRKPGSLRSGSATRSEPSKDGYR